MLIQAHRRDTPVCLKGFLESGEKHILVGFKVNYYIFTDNEIDIPKIRNEADYLFMMDINSIFHNRFGAESLSRLSAVLHRGYYKTTRDNFPYERRPKSTAYIPHGEGDYYYTAAVWGGYLEDMYRLVRYLLYNKPTKVLSPEYLWSDYDQIPQDIKVVRIS
ncbi:hypothetical protein Q5P01_006813 [Channa striata]|uniref:Uncharacterized protein n=1 Tax=Channa striata TaxID=64152 RepID=A0AA88N8P7_CHASR|nr:hypothetical protein Q5P01_006813 [Channa striata]